MNNSFNGKPIETLQLFPILDKLLLELLHSLTEDEWHAPTIARLWSVKDIASHLLDGNLRGLSTSRDHFEAENSTSISSYADLVSYLNQLNQDWIKATKRLSPGVIIALLEITGRQYTDHLNTLNPMDQSIYPVTWAGQDTSLNWFHIAREYTEKFLHQQQIRDAVHKPGLFTQQLFYPFIDTFMYGLTHTYRNVEAIPGTVISVQVNGLAGGMWSIIKRESGWTMIHDYNQEPDAMISIDPTIAWKLFSKGMTPEDANKQVKIKGNHALGAQALKMVSVMA